jgi:hypothetical protein
VLSREVTTKTETRPARGGANAGAGASTPSPTESPPPRSEMYDRRRVRGGEGGEVPSARQRMIQERARRLLEDD